MTKYYRAKKDNFLWSKGAILKINGETKKYEPVSDLWDVDKDQEVAAVPSVYIENNSDWFERVYQINLISKTVYRTKEQAKAHFAKEYTE